jgi:hypothetical protein
MKLVAEFTCFSVIIKPTNFWSICLVEKLVVSQLVTKIPTLHETGRFSVALTRAQHWSVSEPDEARPSLQTLFI